jgi:hypothetical protein
MEEYKEFFMSCDSKGNSYRLYQAEGIWLVLEQKNTYGTFLTGFLEFSEAVDALYLAGCDIDELRPPEQWAEPW